MSPTIATCRPLKVFLLRRIVYASSSACEGCSCNPSPALMTGTSKCCAIRWGAPAELVAVEAKGRYRGPGVREGLVKTTLTLRFGSSLRSLAREDVNAWRDAAARRLLALPGAAVDGVPAAN